MNTTAPVRGRLRTTAACMLLSLLIALATALPARAGSDSNAAVAVNTKDDAYKFKLAFDLVRTMDGIVDQSNAAVAAASCSNCTTVAIAVQIVLVMTDATVVAPVNMALSLNVDCSSCTTLTSAFQLVMSTGGMVQLTPEGRRALDDIRKQLHDLKHSTLSGEEVMAQAQQLESQLIDLLATQLEPIGAPADQSASAETTPAPSPSSSPSDTTSPAASANPTPSDPASPSPSSSPSPSDSSSPSPSPSPSSSPSPSDSPSPSVSPSPSPSP